MKAKKKLFAVTLLIILGATVIIGSFLYTPPLFRGGAIISRPDKLGDSFFLAAARPGRVDV